MKINRKIRQDSDSGHYGCNIQRSLSNNIETYIDLHVSQKIIISTIWIDIEERLYEYNENFK